MRKHERIALEAILAVAGELGLEATVLPHGGKSHMRVRLANPGTGQHAVLTVSSTSRGGDDVVKGTSRQQARRMGIQLAAGTWRGKK